MKINDESGDKKYFTIIPNYILNHSTMYDREVYIQMKRVAGENGTCWMSQTNLAKQCGLSVNRLKKSIKYLKAHQWIKEIGARKTESSGGKQKTKIYEVVDLWNLNNNYYQGISRNDTPKAKGVSPDDTKGYHQKATKKNPVKKNIYIPTKEEVIKYFESNSYQKEIAIKAFEYYEAGNWKDSNGKKVKNWKQKMRGVWFKEENKNKQKTYAPHY